MNFDEDMVAKTQLIVVYAKKNEQWLTLGAGAALVMRVLAGIEVP